MTIEPIATTPAATLRSLNRPLPQAVRWFLLILCAALPTAYVIKQYEVRHDLTQMIFFGQAFQAKALPEIRQLKVATDSIGGYDGQFYAQIAIDPALRNPALLGAMDDPGVREQRIFLPFLAFLLGGGKPASILFVYAILSLFFWYGLLALLIWQVRPTNARHFLVIFAITWTSGALFCVERALPDLAASTLGLLSLNVVEPAGALLIALAMLAKPTSGLFVLRYVWPLPQNLLAWAMRGGLVLCALLPFVFWQFYVWHAIPRATATDPAAFSPPVLGCLQSEAQCWDAWKVVPYRFLFREITLWENNLFGFLGPISVTVQCVFLLARPRWRDPVWLMGAGFAVLFFFFSPAMIVGELGYARTVLPATIAFNLLILEVRRLPLFLLYLITGNIGLLLILRDMLGFLWRR